MIDAGDSVPDFCLPNQDGEEVCIRDFLGRWLVIYLYPRDNTSGCTREAKDFSRLIDEFRSLGAEILGISPR